MKFFTNATPSNYLQTALLNAPLLRVTEFTGVDRSLEVESRSEHSRVGKVEGGVELEYVDLGNTIYLCVCDHPCVHR